MRFQWFAIGLAGLASASCTTTLKSEVAADNIAGASYFLPFLQYEIKATATLATCEAAATKASPATQPTIDLKVEATPQFARGEEFIIDYRTLAAPTKISTINLTYHPNGALKTFNTAADDRTAKVITESVGAVARIALLASPIGRPVSGPGSAACKPAVLAKLQGLKKAQAEAKEMASLVSQQSDALQQLLREAALGPPDLARTGKIVAAERALDTANKRLTAGKAAADEAKAAVSTSVKFLWPTTPTETSAYRVMPELVTTAHDWIDGLDPTAIDQALGLALVDQTTHRKTGPTDLTKLTATGVHYRAPVEVRLRVCKFAAAQSCGVADPEKVYLESPITPAPQRGQIRTLPFRSGPFQDLLLTATFTDGGALESVGYESKRASAEAAAAALNSSLQTAVETRQTIVLARQTEAARKADSLVLQAERDMKIANAQAAVAEAQLKATKAQADTPILQQRSEDAEFEAKIAEAELKAAKARKDLADLATPP